MVGGQEEAGIERPTYVRDGGGDFPRRQAGWLAALFLHPIQWRPAASSLRCKAPTGTCGVRGGSRQTTKNQEE